MRKNDVVVITQGKDVQYLTFFCRFCKKRHTIAVRSPNKTIPISFKGTYFKWNGDRVEPTIENGFECIHFTNYHGFGSKRGACHSWIRGGKQKCLSIYGKDSIDRLLPVSQWPDPLPFRRKLKAKAKRPLTKTAKRAR